MFRTWLSKLEPSRILLIGYLMIMLVGFLFLLLPFAQSTSQSALDHLFVAVSAVSTTGLSTISVSDNYNLFGEIIVLFLIQIGGIGYMSVASFIIFGNRKRMSDFTSRLLRVDFSLGESAELVGFIKSVIYFTAIIEALGAVALSLIFYTEGVSQPIWNGIFHSISAFCTAGFSLFNDSFINFSDNVWLNVVITLLSLAGSIGFLVFVNVYQRVLGKTKKLALTSKIILRFTLVLLLISTTLMFLSETNFDEKSSLDQFLLSVFQSMTALTTVGFNTFPIDQLSPALLYIVVFLMLVGASPAGTGGGIKSTSVTALFAVVKSTLKGNRKITFMGSVIPDDRLRLAAANFFFYVVVLYLAILCLSYTEALPIFDLMFEASSAIGTVGLSTGITGDLSALGKFIIIFLMIVGRLGAATFGLALFKNDNPAQPVQAEKEDVVI